MAEVFNPKEPSFVRFKQRIVELLKREEREAKEPKRGAKKT